MMLVGTALQGRMIGEYMIGMTGTLTDHRMLAVSVEPKTDGTYNLKTICSLSTATLGGNYSANGNSWNANGTTLAATFSNISPYLKVYNKVGNTFTNELTYVGDTGNTGAFRALAWHPSGNYLVVGRNANSRTGQINFWERDGDTLTLDTSTFNVQVTATIGVIQTKWNPQGTTLAVGSSQAPYLMFYNFDPATKQFTKIIDPAVDMPTTLARAVAWNHDGSSIAVAEGNSNRLRIYNREGDNFVTAITILETSAHQDLAWSGDGTQLVAGIQLSPFIRFYYRPPGTTATLHTAATPAVTATNYAIDVDISQDGLFVATSVVFNQNANQFYYRDPATTSTWINLGIILPEAPSNSRGVHIYPGLKP